MGIDSGTVLEETLAQEIHPAIAPPAEVRHILEVIADEMKDVPIEEFAKLPADGASPVEHCLYRQPEQ